MGEILIAVPLFKAPELIAGLFGSLAAMADEIDQLPARILLINDSPDDADLRDVIEIELPALRRLMSVEIIENAENIGFVRSANRAFEIALQTGADLLLLNSDTLPRPGAFAEMAAVARLDPMISVVSPRSDNATICNSPYPPSWRSGSRDQSYAHHRAVEHWLPRYSFVPTAVGFCLLIRHAMIDEFGCFDEIYGGGYNEENDFIRRCNRRGYRAVLANHAYVHHLGGSSFAASAISSADREALNRAILIDRYPEYGLSVQRYFDGPEYRAQMLVAGLIPDERGRLRVLFDCRTLECSYKGTFEHACQLLQALARLAEPDYEIFVLCERAAFEFHALDAVPGLRFCERDDVHDRPFALAMRPVQPFLLEDIVTLGDYAPITGVLMLDTIAMDCQQLDTHGLDVLWRSMTEAVSMIGYNSAFTRDQFTRRIDVSPQITQFVSRCSTDVADYARPAAQDESRSSAGILVVGNNYPHKFVAETANAIRVADPTARVSVLGATQAGGDGSGRLSPAEVEALYADARCIVYPSHYEGFGLPILHGLARHRPVIARDLPSAREIAERTAGANNLHLRGSTSEMVEQALRRSTWDEPAAPPLHQSWGDAAQAVLDAFADAHRRFDFATCQRQQASLAGHRARLEAERRFHEQAAATEVAANEAHAEADRRAREADLRDEAARDRENESASALAATTATLVATESRLETTLRSLTMATVRLTDAEQAGRHAEARLRSADLRAEAGDHIVAALLPVAGMSLAQITMSGAWRHGAPSILSGLRFWIRRRASKRRLVVVDLDDPALQSPAALLTGVSLASAATTGNLPDILRTSMNWTEKVRIGGRLRLSWPSSLVDNVLPGHSREQVMSVAFAALGFLPLRIVVRRGHCEADGIRVADETSLTSVAGEDIAFLRLAYLFALGREPDLEGSKNYMAQLTSGTSRAEVLRTLLVSSERLQKLLIAGAPAELDQR